MTTSTSFIWSEEPAPGRRFTMVHDLVYTLRADEVEILPTHSISGVSVSMALEPIPAVMSESALAAHCKREINNYRQGKTSDERYCLELLRRATLQRDQS